MDQVDPVSLYPFICTYRSLIIILPYHPQLRVDVATALLGLHRPAGE
jgi:hypothetical protein